MPLAELESQFRNSLARGEAPHGALQALLASTGARATGIWRVVEDRLEQVAFEAATDMPEDVRREFAETTLSVPLERTGLGIVKAVVSGEPTVAERGSETGGLSDSAGWLARFGAQQSLAVPMFKSGKVTGVLAISTADPLSPESPAWKLVTSLGERLGGYLAR